MTKEYYHLVGATEVVEENFLLPRAESLKQVAIENVSCTILSLWRFETDNECISECLVIEIECDGVPHNNEYGLLYRERIALCVPSDEEKLVDVFALRKSFPELTHLNDTPPGTPLSLCLYFESPISVLRTWTPQAFLHRVKWWIESSSKGQLHPSDQPVEQLFFTTKYELILPSNYEELRENSESKFVIIPLQERPNQGITFALKQDNTDTFKSIDLLDFTLPEVIQGRIFRSPSTLGELISLLQTRDIDFIECLKKQLNILIGETGSHADQQSAFTAIFLRIPIVRRQGQRPEKVEKKAFLLNEGHLTIAESMGLSFISPTDHKYYLETPFGEGSVDMEGNWTSHSIFPMEILYFNDLKQARFQSGIVDSGPKGVIIGAGSLGAALWNNWARSGWGEWTIIDNDHIKPHNLSRHIAIDHEVGIPKSDLLSTLSKSIYGGTANVVSIYANACDFSNQEVLGALNESELIIDVSTTIEYPRLSSSLDKVGRHASTYLTPRGGSAILFIEDSDRQYRLRTLEAQYFRAVINEAWGNDHIEVDTSGFWSGASCRDISTILSYSKILAHAGNIAEQIQERSKTEAPFIGVWNRKIKTGEVIFYEIPPCKEHAHDLGDLTLYLDEGILNKLNALREKGLPRETGGILLGYYDFNVNIVVVVDCLPAPQDSTATETMFERGIEGLLSAVQAASIKTAGHVRYIGEWHSHPDGCSTNPSQNDLIQLSELASAMHDEGLPSLMLIIGEDGFNVFQGTIE